MPQLDQTAVKTPQVTHLLSAIAWAAFKLSVTLSYSWKPYCSTLEQIYACAIASLRTDVRRRTDCKHVKQDNRAAAAMTEQQMKSYFVKLNLCLSVFKICIPGFALQIKPTAEIQPSSPVADERSVLCHNVARTLSVQYGLNCFPPATLTESRSHANQMVTRIAALDFSLQKPFLAIQHDLVCSCG
jgi:hypothetical protein